MRTRNFGHEFYSRDNRRAAGSSCVATIVAILIALGALSASGRAQAGGCSSFTPVTSCETINTAGCFEVTTSITATSSSADCIQIATSNVLLKLNEHSISGPGSSSTAAGIHVLPTFVNSKGKTVAVTTVRIAGQGGSVSSFGVGVLVGTPGASSGPSGITIDNLSSYDNNADGIQLIKASGCVLSVDTAEDNHANGIELDAGSTGNLVSDSSAESNQQNGIVVSANSNTLAYNYAASNQQNGIVVSANSNTLAYDNASDNKQYGIWVNGASSNELAANTADSNDVAGIFLGTSSTGPGGSATSGSKGNQLNSNSASSNGTSGAGWGIAIQSKSSGNSVVNNSASGNLTDDLFDGNPGCDSNNWFADSFTSANLTCID